MIIKTNTKEAMCSLLPPKENYTIPLRLFLNMPYKALISFFDGASPIIPSSPLPEHRQPVSQHL